MGYPDVMAHPAEIAKEHISAALEACQSDSSSAECMETLARHLAQAQGKLFPAVKLEPSSPAAVDLMRRSMEYLAQGLKVMQDIKGGGSALERTLKAVAMALKTLHPAVQQAKSLAQRQSEPSPLPPKSSKDLETGAVAVTVSTMLGPNSDHQLYSGFSENIEKGGIFIATFDPKPVQSKVVVDFRLPGDLQVTAEGVVHFVREYNPLTPETPPGMGVRFISLSPQHKRAIEQYLKTRAPMFYDDES